jgi:tRNA-dihydrouridine synthase
VIVEHYQLLCDLLGERKAALSMRGILLWYTRGLPHSGGFRARIGTMRDKESLFSVMDHYFSELGEQQK